MYSLRDIVIILAEGRAILLRDIIQNPTVSSKKIFRRSLPDPKQDKLFGRKENVLNTGTIYEQRHPFTNAQAIWALGNF